MKKNILIAIICFTFLINAGGGSSLSSGPGRDGGPSLTGQDLMNQMRIKNDLRLVEQLIYGKKYKKAIKKLKIMDNQFTNNADVQNYLGFSYRKMNELGKSATHYKNALRINPRHLGALEYQVTES